MSLWILSVLGGVFLAVFALVSTVPRGAPDEAQARREFLAEHPGCEVDRVTKDEHEVVAVSYRIFYRAPGDSTLHEAFWQYVHSDGAWRITPTR